MRLLIPRFRAQHSKNIAPGRSRVRATRDNKYRKPVIETENGLKPKSTKSYLERANKRAREREKTREPGKGYEPAVEMDARFYFLCPLVVVWHIRRGVLPNRSTPFEPILSLKVLIK
ncbi:hypothetical protein NPIL_88451 [Nephila pilipes]|uniref:Uncharacterized protein n=1 Tax=Nephila pilipes TaxID=299642 RepID=A0A8X6NJZ6_NEPPI|nr:hypothetical protein NPIL_88451 [Nephila pilipes]